MGRPVRDLTKEGTFGRLTAIKHIGRRHGANAYFLCLCECGKEIEAKGSHLVSGNIKSCGCLQRDNCAAVGRITGGWNKTHGASGTPAFNSWRSMLNRCGDPLHEDYYNYGGRGITVCERWIESFENFLSDMGERPKGTTIDRKDSNGNYEPGNCRWATNREQQTNKSTNVRLALGGTTLTIVEWSERLGISPKTIWSRMNILGWSVERTLTEPVHERN